VATESVLNDLRSEIVRVRRTAAIQLGRLGDRAAVAGLIAALSDPDAGVRRESAKALGRIRATAAVPALVQALGDADTDVRFYAAYSLGELKVPAAVPALLAAMADPAWRVRDQAAWALRETPSAEVVDAMMEALAAPAAKPDVIVWILQKQDRDESVARLIGLLRADDPVARIRALRALAAFEAGRAVEPMRRALEDPDAEVRLAAIEGLCTLGAEGVESSLRKMARNDADSRVRQAAQEAVKRLMRHDDLAAYWSFDDGNAQTAEDVTGNGSDGEIKGATPVEGKQGKALRFTGGQYVELGRPENLHIGNLPLTIAAWIKAEAPTGVVVARGGGFCGFSLYLLDGVPKFGIHRVQDGPAYIAAAEKQIPMGEWVHLAGVVQEKSVRIYVNGAPAGESETPGYIPGDCGQGMEIGFDTANSPCEIVDPFEGLIDEVRVYHAALAEANLTKLIELAE
jgi:HEAT repeat protein